MSIDTDVLSTSALGSSDSDASGTAGALGPETHRRRWQWQSPLGLLAVGFGASLLGHATLMKKDADDRGASTWAWVAAGTASLIALNAGLSLFGDAVKHRALYESKQ